VGPPGDYTTGPVQSGYTRPQGVWPEGGTEEIWEGDTGTITLVFDPQQHVAITAFDHGYLSPIGPLERLVWRLNRQWRTLFPE